MNRSHEGSNSPSFFGKYGLPINAANNGSTMTETVAYSSMLGGYGNESYCSAQKKEANDDFPLSFGANREPKEWQECSQTCKFLGIETVA